MTTTNITAGEVKIGDCIRFSACKPHVITDIQPYDEPGWTDALAFYAGTWAICVSRTTTVRLITEGA